MVPIDIFICNKEKPQERTCWEAEENQVTVSCGLGLGEILSLHLNIGLHTEPSPASGDIANGSTQGLVDVTHNILSKNKVSRFSSISATTKRFWPLNDAISRGPLRGSSLLEDTSGSGVERNLMINKEKQRRKLLRVEVFENEFPDDCI